MFCQKKKISLSSRNETTEANDDGKVKKIVEEEEHQSGDSFIKVP